MNDATRNEFIARMKDRLDELDRKIEELKHKADKFDAQAKKEYENRLNDLRGKRRELRRKVDDLQSVGSEQWQKMKDEAEHAWKALGNSFNYFKSHFQ